MRNYHKAVLTTLAATAMLALAVGTATAGRLRTSEKNAELKWTSLEYNVAGNVIRCPVTVLGSFEESTIVKRVGSTIGRIRHIELNNAACTGGGATILTETFPWPITYESFGGTLPRITSLELLAIGARFKVRPTGSVECLAGTTTEHPGGLIAAISNGVVGTVRVDETKRIPLGGGFLCSFAGESNFAGNGSATNLPGTASLTVTLI